MSETDKMQDSALSVNKVHVDENQKELIVQEELNMIFTKERSSTEVHEGSLR